MQQNKYLMNVIEQNIEMLWMEEENSRDWDTSK